jgi:hypothetical protein
MNESELINDVRRRRLSLKIAGCVPRFEVCPRQPQTCVNSDQTLLVPSDPVETIGVAALRASCVLKAHRLQNIEGVLLALASGHSGSDCPRCAVMISATPHVHVRARVLRAPHAPLPRARAMGSRIDIRSRARSPGLDWDRSIPLRSMPTI